MTYQHILVPVDGSETSYKAIQEAIKFSKSLNSKITLVQVLELDPYIAEGYLTTGQTNPFIERAREYLSQTIADAKQKFQDQGINVETLLLEGISVTDKILEAAKDTQADLIIIGSHGRTGLSKLFLGSQTQKVLAQTTIPVLVVR
ncbi:universal stress protein [Acinetobacter qingfengensis]|uniref:Universal stress protein n=1 Tax=Acinetobacter qingfengensis TaxID=1262585 RepID=A0A1E7RET1_9GAMM|nr:universal stress protein [Acinetobacter qingfengensis]KAA8731134.1 universal stress protein [Acinetobacter qingfengensis]OEY97803.1 universal stress protein [Acinetobacter qingfengensis]